MPKKLDQPFECEFCGKAFRRENSVIIHACEQKRRFQQKNERGVQLGFMAYQRFYKLRQNVKKAPSYEDFCKSQFYLGFVKFGRHIKMTSALKPDKFIDYVIKSGKKLDKWCTDRVYEEYLHDMLRRENPNDTLERAFAVMIEWGDENNAPWKDYFRYAHPSKICMEIWRGRISPWVLYNCKSGVEFLSRANEDQLADIFPYIDPDFWMKKFDDYLVDTEFVKETLAEAGL